ncbi:MAG: HD domain-containing protein [Ferruginibacter sp.]
MRFFEEIKLAVLERLEKGLPPELHYHSVGHTKDVQEQAERIALAENVHSKEEIYLLKIACIFHDTGFLFTYKEHEERGYRIAEETLPAFGIGPKELEIIRGLIMATRIPQSPQNRLEEIICDADLDYLGRDDFFSISQKLFNELQVLNMVKSEDQWNQIQVKFFRQHSYFTRTNKELRTAKKNEHLKIIEATIINTE